MKFCIWTTAIGMALVMTCSFVHARDIARDASNDIRFLSARIAADHPGMVNPGDPDFRHRANEAARDALRKAGKARTDSDYRDVLNSYVASFEDPHLSVELNDSQDTATTPPATAPAPRGSFEQLGPGISLLTLPTFYAGEPGFDDVIHAIDQAEKELAKTTPDTLVIDLRGNGGGASEPGDRVLMAIWGSHALPALAGRRAKSSAWRASHNVLHDLEQRRSRIAQRYPTELAGYDRLLSGLRDAVSHNQLLYQEPIVPTADRGALKAGPRKVFVITDSACISACLDFMDRIMEAPHVIQVGQATGWDTLYTEVESVSLPSGQGNATIPVQLLQGRYRASRQAYEPTIHLDDDRAISNWMASLEPSVR